MGVDAFIFEKKSKRYFSYDRDYNLSAHMSDESVPEDVAARCEDIKWKLYKKEDVNSEDVIYLAQTCAVAWEKGSERDQYRAINCRGVEAFAKEHGDGQFFVALDNDDAYDFMKDIRHGEGEYSEWKP